jgi:heptosyltransferase I
MAVALGVPVIGLRGYTNPQRVGPYGRFGELLVDEYWRPGEAKDARLEYRAGGMERITVERVMEKVRLWMLR